MKAPSIFSMIFLLLLASGPARSQVQCTGCAAGGGGVVYTGVISGLPTSGLDVGDLASVTDALSDTDCATGGGTIPTMNLCLWNGTSWVNEDSAGSGGSPPGGAVANAQFQVNASTLGGLTGSTMQNTASPHYTQEAQAAGSVPIAVKGVAGQTGDLFQALTNLDAIIARIAANGNIFGTGILGFQGDEDTGIQRIGVGNLGITAGGVITADIKPGSFAINPAVQLQIGNNPVPCFFGAATPGTLVRVSGTVGCIEQSATVASTEITMDVLAPQGAPTLAEENSEVLSAGWVSGGVISPGTGAAVDVTAGTGYIRSSDSPTAPLVAFEWPAANDIGLAADSVGIVGVEYNAGTPQVVIRVGGAPFNTRSEFVLGGALNDAGVIAVAQTQQATGDAIALVNRRFFETIIFLRDSQTGGLVLGETGTRNVTMSAGAGWIRLARLDFAAIDTSAADNFDSYYRDGAGGWIKNNDQTQWPNTQFDDDSGTLQTMGANNSANVWFYLDFSGRLNMVYGQAEYNKSSEALDEAAPSAVPFRVSEFGTIIGKLTFVAGAATATEITSPFATLSGVPTKNHNDLLNLGGDAHPNLTFNDGRAGGQTIIGGSGAGDDLELQTTSNASKGSYRLAELDCTGNANGGKVTTDASGNLICQDDVSGAGGIPGGTGAEIQYRLDASNFGAVPGSAWTTFLTLPPDTRFLGTTNPTGLWQDTDSGVTVSITANGSGLGRLGTETAHDFVLERDSVERLRVTATGVQLGDPAAGSTIIDAFTEASLPSIPAGANEVAAVWDRTSGNFCYGINGEASFRCLTNSDTVNLAVPDPVAGDSLKPFFKLPIAGVITRISCATSTGTSIPINFEERVETTPNTTGTDVMAADLVCDDNTEISTTFANAGIAANAPVPMSIQAPTGTPTFVQVTVEYAY